MRINTKTKTVRKKNQSEIQQRLLEEAGETKKKKFAIETENKRVREKE